MMSLNFYNLYLRVVKNYLLRVRIIYNNFKILKFSTLKEKKNDVFKVLIKILYHIFW